MLAWLCCKALAQLRPAALALWAMWLVHLGLTEIRRSGSGVTWQQCLMLPLACFLRLRGVWAARAGLRPHQAAERHSKQQPLREPLMNLRVMSAARPAAATRRRRDKLATAIKGL